MFPFISNPSAIVFKPMPFTIKMLYHNTFLTDLSASNLIPYLSIILDMNYLFNFQTYRPAFIIASHFTSSLYFMNYCQSHLNIYLQGSALHLNIAQVYKYNKVISLFKTCPFVVRII